MTIEKMIEFGKKATVTSLSAVVMSCSIGCNIQEKDTVQENNKVRESEYIKEEDQAEKHYKLSDDLYRKGDVDGAIKELRKAIKIKPDYAEAHAGLGACLGDKNDFDGAIIESREALKIKSDYAEAHYLLGVALLSKKDYDGAIIELKEALRLGPTEIEIEDVYLGLGCALYKKGKRKEAKEYFDKIPPSADAYDNYIDIKKYLDF